MKMFDFAIIGGDLRQKYLCPILLDAGFSVIIYGVKAEICHARLKYAKCLEEAMSLGRTILAPIPLSRDRTTINCSPALDCPILLSDFVSLLCPCKSLIAGCIPDGLAALCPCTDLMKIETLTIFNSIATAEGLIAETISHFPGNLHHSNCLILGYGRCAKTLADRLEGFHVNLTVAARSSQALIWIEADGHSPLTWDRIGERLPSFDLIFNTVPAVVLNGTMLKRVKKDAMIFDVASAPGGIDRQKADELEISFYACPGLPGKYAPKASAQAIAQFIIKGENPHGVKK